MNSFRILERKKEEISLKINLSNILKWKKNKIYRHFSHKILIKIDN